MPSAGMPAWQRDAVWRRAGDVADADGGGLFVDCEDGERRTAYGGIEGGVEGGLLVVEGAGGVAHDELGAEAVRDLYVHAALAE